MEDGGVIVSAARGLPRVTCRLPLAARSASRGVVRGDDLGHRSRAGADAECAHSPPLRAVTTAPRAALSEPDSRRSVRRIYRGYGASSPRPVHAIASGSVDYAERGHTRWSGPHDTPLCIRLTLDAPIPWINGHQITHVYYAHLSALAFEQAEGASPKRHVGAGEPIGTSGIANGLPHLHLGLLLDGQVEQDDWTFLLREDEVRLALGGYRNGDRLAKE
jgi:murein DD-endopeptidase MepM/ murein hydrolase activator NlpD